jgi:transposase
LEKGRQQRAKLSASNQVAKAIAHSLNRWSGLTRFLDGPLCMSNNTVERSAALIAQGDRTAREIIGMRPRQNF